MDRPRGVGEVTMEVTMRGHHSFFFFFKKSSFVKQSYLMGFRDSQFFVVFFFLATAHSMQDLSSPTRN